MAKAKASKAAKKNPAKAKKDLADREAGRLMQLIDESEAAGAGVPRSVTIELYETIAQLCQERVQLIRSEMEGDEG